MTIIPKTSLEPDRILPSVYYICFAVTMMFRKEKDIWIKRIVENTTGYTFEVRGGMA